MKFPADEALRSGRIRPHGETSITHPIEVVRPESVGLSSERLARIEAHLERRYIVPQKIAGALTLVARKGDVAYLSCVGQMDIERNKPMSEHTIFRIYSMSKPITSVGLMMLYEHGHFGSSGFRVG